MLGLAPGCAISVQNVTCWHSQGGLWQPKTQFKGRGILAVLNPVFTRRRAGDGLLLSHIRISAATVNKYDIAGKVIFIMFFQQRD